MWIHVTMQTHTHKYQTHTLNINDIMYKNTLLGDTHALKNLHLHHFLKIAALKS